MFTFCTIGPRVLAASLILALALVPTVAGQTTDAPLGRSPDWAAPHVSGQLIVKLSEGATANTNAQLARAGARVVRTLPQLGLSVVEVSPDVALATMAATLRATAGAAWAEPNYTFTLDLTPNDPAYPTQEPYLKRIEMAAGWEYTTGRPEIVIAILDTGVDMAHPDLASAIWVNPGEISGDGVDNDANGFIDDINGWDFADNDNLPDDDHGHGTHVAGIAGARVNNGIGIAGVAGAVTLMPVDVFRGGIGTYEDLIRAIIYATDNGAHVINLSLGASSYSLGEQMAVDYAWARGVVVVAAAGNTGTERYHYPAAHEHVIAVAATTRDDVLANFSTRGDFVDVAAPGVSIYSTYRDGAYAFMSGTSMATPHVAGLAGLILARNPALTPDAVRALIEGNADDLGAYGWDDAFGHGRINARRTLAATLPSEEPVLPPEPGPPLAVWPPGCQELIPDGDFEAGAAAWQLSGSALVDTTQAYSGTQALHLPGGPDTRAAVTRTVTLPSWPPVPMAGTLWFAYRIETSDWGRGATPSFPYDDWLTVEFRSAKGQLVSSLLRTGNTADTSSSGLPWDRYLYRMERVALGILKEAGDVNLVFTAANDADSAATSFWIDEVRFCATNGYVNYWPLVMWSP